MGWDYAGFAASWTGAGSYFPDAAVADTVDSNALDRGRDRGTAHPTRQTFYFDNCATNAATLGL